MPILPARLNDVPEIAALVNGAYRGPGAQRGWTSESHLLEGIRIGEAELEDYFENPAITMLKYVTGDKKIAGFVYLEKLESNKLYLGMLTVDPTMQAAGIGRQLLAAADEHARKNGCAAIKITVITTRLELIEWYKRRGFVDTGNRMPLVTSNHMPLGPVELMIMEKL